jgi:hypothetical protein
MVRLVSVFGIAFLTLAAVAVVAASRKQTEEPAAEPDAPEPVRATRPRLYPAAAPSYYAQFSLN